MGFDEDFLRELLSTFVAEAQEHVDAATSRLLALEKGLDGVTAFQHWADVFREIHSLKGAARAMNLERVESVAHRLETLIGRARNGEVTPTPAFYTLVYRALDVLCDLVREAGGLSPAAAVDLPALLAQLEATNFAPEAQPMAAGPQPSQPEAAAGPDAEPVAAPAPASTLQAAPATVPTVAAGDMSPQAAPTEPAAPTPGGASAIAAEESVRVATAKLEALMAQMGELQVARLGAEQRAVELRSLVDDLVAWEAEFRPRPTPVAASAAASDALAAAELAWTRLREMSSRLRGLQRRYEADQRRFSQVMAGLQDDVRRLRMLPISTLFAIYPRMVRDMAHELGKNVALIIQGGDTEVDRSVLEQIKDPITHLLRNALDHGVELPQERAEAGKPATATITLAAAQHGDSIIITVADDGRGIDVARVRESALRRGIISAEEARAMSDQDALWLIFRSGVSTSRAVTGVSGRGVGMDVVRDKVERLHGLIDVRSAPGAGTTFILTLPLTVATTLCLLVQAAGQTFAVPITNVIRIVRLQAAAIGYAEGQVVIRSEGRPILLLNLAQVLGLSDVGRPASRDGREATSAVADSAVAVILGSAEKRLAFRVDAVTNAQEVVVKALPKPFLRVRYLAGASILGTGEVILVLNPADLLRAAASAGPVPAVEAPTTPTEPSRPRTIMVVDDSITTRTLEKNILEAAGYTVRVFGDGLEAWEALQNEGIAPRGTFDLVVSDVLMPRLNGFDLTARVRADARLKDLPIVLVTSLGSQEDRERGVQAGADAYIVKAAFDQDALLDTIRRLI